MRFPQAWAEIAKQNNVLRIAILGVSVSGLLALLISMKFAFKEPLIIERGCFSKAVTKTTVQDPTKADYEAFTREALAQRFDSDANILSEYIAIEELKNRDSEQDELKRRNIKQRVTVNSISRNDDQILIDADRLLSVGNLRSAFQFPLVLFIQKQSRSQSNPYGLVLLKVSPQNPEEGKKNVK